MLGEYVTFLFVCFTHFIHPLIYFHPTEETHFSHLYPQSHSFGHYPKLETIDENMKTESLSAQLHNGPVQRHITADST